MELKNLRKSSTGLFWPDYDVMAEGLLYNEIMRLEDIIALVRGKRVVVQAGGNVGLWPLRLIELGFESVFTFEPDRLNFLCLQLNTFGVKGIYPFPMALSDGVGYVTMEQGEAGNCGATFVHPIGTTLVEPARTTLAVSIDMLRLPHLDLLLLDVEGYELFALEGAKQTILENLPVICIEEKHGERYGLTKEAARYWLLSHGYKVHHRAGRDTVMVAG